MSATSAAEAASTLEVKADGQVAIGGRDVSCGRNIRTILDPKIPNLGIATRNLLVMNPALLDRHSQTVRLFVFHHECGHHHVGGDELGADCWAVKAGIKGGWLGQRQLADVCASFGNAPETRTHPSAARRCRALQQCFQHAEREQQQQAAAQRPATGAMEMVKVPTLMYEGTLRGK